MSTTLATHVEGELMSEIATLTVLYGSQTGNAEYLAHEIHEQASMSSEDIAVCSLEDWLHSSGRRLQRLLVVTSTHDNGHMPDNAAPFWDWLKGLEDRALAGLPYAVLSIGDSMYEDFCKAGHDIDRRLSQLGANRVVEGIDCDVDFEFSAPQWAKSAVEQLLASPAWERSGAPEASETATPPDVPTVVPSERYARIAKSRLLSGEGSAKQVMHYELVIEDGSIDYEPGDSIAVYPRNSDALVQEWLDIFGDITSARGKTGEDKPLRNILHDEVELRLVHPGLIVALGRLRPDAASVRDALALIESGERATLDEWLYGRDILDVLIDLECTDLPVEAVLGELRPLQRREYSISSSPRKDDGRVHITVSSVVYSTTRDHQGAASCFLRRCAQTGESFRVAFVPRHDFRLPLPDAPVIMIGPGVGVAPFRAFLRDRDACGAHGRNWLFFGDQHRASDWLYEQEFAQLSKSGVLDRIDLAFSRDGAEKYYVQHDMRAHAKEFRAWLEDGAYVFVCGDKTRMAPDVDQAMLDILAGRDGDNHLSADDWLTMLKSQGRYVKDVY